MFAWQAPGPDAHVYAYPGLPKSRQTLNKFTAVLNFIWLASYQSITNNNVQEYPRTAIQEIPCFQVNRRIVAAFKRARYWTLSSAS
jgi:hypothetical protein